MRVGHAAVDEREAVGVERRPTSTSRTSRTRRAAADSSPSDRGPCGRRARPAPSRRRVAVDEEPLDLVLRRIVAAEDFGALEQRRLARVEVVVVHRGRRDEATGRCSGTTFVSNSSFALANTAYAGSGKLDAMRLGAVLAQVVDLELRQPALAQPHDHVVLEEVDRLDAHRLAVRHELRPVRLREVVDRRRDDAVVDPGVVGHDVEAVAAMLGVVLVIGLARDHHHRLRLRLSRPGSGALRSWSCCRR